MALSRDGGGQRRADAIALSAAIAGHVVLLGALCSVPIPSREGAFVVAAVELELAHSNESGEIGAVVPTGLLALAPSASPPTVSAHSTERSLWAVTPRRAEPALERDMPDRNQVAPERHPAPEHAGEASGGTPRTEAGIPQSVPPRRPIDIWLRDPSSRLALLNSIERQPPAVAPSVGLLREGLAEADAARGLARSSAAVSASYEAARRYAPANGTATFELRTDANGRVQTVQLLSAAYDHDAWERFAEHLRALLQNRRMRVPAGSQGLLTQLRIERGELAVSPYERNHAKTAVGQGPVHPKEDRGESTRAHIDEPGRLSPTLGVGAVGSGKFPPTRVALLDEHAL